MNQIGLHFSPRKKRVNDETYWMNLNRRALLHRMFDVVFSVFISVKLNFMTISHSFRLLRVNVKLM